MKPIGNLFNRVKGAAQVLGFGSAAPPSPKKEVYPSQGDIAWADGSFFGRQPMEKWNPDDLIARRGYGVLRKMVQDDQIRALLRLKTAMITSRGYHFSHSQTSAPHQECARFFEFMVSRLLEGSFSSALAQMLSSQTAGFSVTEKIYTPCDWQGRTLWGVNRLKTRPASTFVFETDPHG
ncbi:MAG: hypothetical protein OEW12_09430, partial [Deltaproteobacteria bacterium]|nr:hypothetical protein [Deltaproteobacteria bacterium]